MLSLRKGTLCDVRISGLGYWVQFWLDFLLLTLCLRLINDYPKLNELGKTSTTCINTDLPNE